MIETVGIRFKEGGKIYDFDADVIKAIMLWSKLFVVSSVVRLQELITV